MKASTGISFRKCIFCTEKKLTNILSRVNVLVLENVEMKNERVRWHERRNDESLA